MVGKLGTYDSENIVRHDEPQEPNSGKPECMSERHIVTILYSADNESTAPPADNRLLSSGSGARNMVAKEMALRAAQLGR